MDISKKIALKLEEREKHTKAMEDLIAKAEAEERGFDEEEQKDFDSNESMIKTIDIEIENLERMEKAIGTQKARPVEPVQPEVAPRITSKSMQDPKLFLARQAHCLYMTGGNRTEAAAYAKTLGDDPLAQLLSIPAKALEHMITRATTGAGTTQDPTWAEPLTTIQQANSAFIEMLRAASVVARFPGRQMAFGGDNTIEIPKQDTGAAGSWVGEGAPIAVGSLGFSTVTLTPKKAAIIVPSTAELLRKSSPSAMMLIQDDIVAGTATTVDTKFISGDAEVARVSPAGILQGITGIVSTGATLANIDADLKAITNSLIAANVPMTSPVWLMNPTTLNSLSHIREGTGAKAFPETERGMLGAYPVIASTVVGTDSVILTDASTVAIASDYAPIIDVSEDATLVMESDQALVTDISSEILATTAADRIQSMYQHDQVAIRLKMAIDWVRRHDTGTDHLTGVAW